MKESLFHQIMSHFHEVIKEFVDKRTGKNTSYSMEDIALSAFSLFYTQSPSFLAFQELMKENQGQSNAQTLFGIEKIPTDNHIRTMLDKTKPEAVFPVFDRILSVLSEQGLLSEFKSIGGTYLVAIDGTEYFQSGTLSCSSCQQKEYPDGIHYSHSALTPVIVCPGRNQVVTLRPEFITPQDGQEKQDCEINAAKRWLSHFAENYDWKATFLGDDLYAPFL